MSATSLVDRAPVLSVHPRGWRRIFSFPVVISGFLVVLAVLTVRGRFDDPDMWWHLKTGEIVWTTHSIPVTDLFSYTTNHHAWIPHEWLSQVSIYGAYRLGGYAGLMLWLCVLTSALIIAGYILCSIYSGNPKAALPATLSLWFFSTVGLAIRPQMIGYFLLIVELFLIYLGRTRNPRYFWALPPLFALWVNCHGSFFLGIVVAALFLACSFFDFQTGLLTASAWEPKRRVTLGLALLLSFAALFLNPSGMNLVLYPLNTMLHQPVSLMHVEEWRPLQLAGPRGLGFMIILAGVFLLIIVQKSKLFLDELGLLALGAWLAASHDRMLFVFGILSAPVLSRLLSPYCENYDAKRDRPWLNAVVIAICLLVVVCAFPTRQFLVAQVEKENPVKAVEFIKSQHLSGPMLNDYVFGGYLIWALPDHPVFVDGRGDVFEWAGVLDKFGEWATLKSDPNDLLNKYKIHFCLLTRTAPMTHVLPLMPGWKEAYSDNVSEIFVRSGTTAGPN